MPNQGFLRSIFKKVGENNVGKTRYAVIFFPAVVFLSLFDFFDNVLHSTKKPEVQGHFPECIVTLLSYHAVNHVLCWTRMQVKVIVNFFRSGFFNRTILVLLLKY